MIHLDLCSGIGGFALAAKWAGFQTVQFVEIDDWCKKILNKHWPSVPVHSDLKTFNGASYHGAIDILTAGYPCQPFSVAGKQLGEKDERHLWPDVLRIIKECKPRWVICENVEGHVKLGYDTVHTNLEKEGYTVWPFIIPASGIGARHKRNRLWIVAHTKSGRGRGGTDNDQEKRFASCKDAQSISSGSDCRNVSHSYGTRLQTQGPKLFTAGTEQYSPERYWSTEPSMGRVVNGLSRRVDRIKGLGNAVVPQIPYLIMETIKGYELTVQQ